MSVKYETPGRADCLMKPENLSQMYSWIFSITIIKDFKRTLHLKGGLSWENHLLYINLLYSICWKR